MHIVLVHGIFHDGAIFKRLMAQLDSHGHRCWAPALKPTDGRTGIQDLAQQLQRYIDQHLGPDEAFTLVGFSMGSIVGRYYLQVLGGARRVPAFFAIAGPHQGTRTAYLFYGRGAVDMRPHSALMRLLHATEAELKPVALHAYWTSLDLVILPATSCDWPLAPVRINARALLHRFMPAHAQVCQDIVERVNALARFAPAR